MLELKDVFISFGIQEVLKEISLKIVSGDRIALVGENGAGKSTFLKLAARALEPLSGTVVTQRDVRIGYLPQAGLSHIGKTVWEEMIEGLPELNCMQKEQRDILEKMQGLSEGDPEDGKLLARYGELETRFSTIGGYSMESKILSILHGLGFQEKDRDRRTETFSGGWQMRIALARLLLEEYDMLLLDEPTDHLDLEARNWLVDYLKAYTGALLVVSHDRYFLDVVANKVFEIVNKRLEGYSGNYTKYLQEKIRRADSIRERHLRQKEQVERIKIFIDKNRSRKDRARQVQSRIRHLERIQLVSPPVKERHMKINLPSPAACARRQIELAQIEKSYGDRNIFSGVDLLVERGERIAVVGPNGTGKSTLLRLIGGQEPFQKGLREVGTGVSIGYFCQDQISSLNSALTVIEDMMNSAPLIPTERLRTVLGCFLFRGQDVFKQISFLSGGERTRLSLAKLLLKSHNLLLLDEPTNHLDLASKEALLEALLGSTCSLVFVSHDRYFINHLATRILEVGHGAVRSYLGDYEDYQAALHREREEEDMSARSGGKVQRSNGRKEVEQVKRDRILTRQKHKHQAREERKRVRQIEVLENEIADLEKEIQALDSEMSRQEVSTDFMRLSSLQADRDGRERRLHECLDMWGRIIEAVDNGESP